jgi:hypothetical protein
MSVSFAASSVVHLHYDSEAAASLRFVAGDLGGVAMASGRWSISRTLAGAVLAVLFVGTSAVAAERDNVRIRKLAEAGAALRTVAIEDISKTASVLGPGSRAVMERFLPPASTPAIRRVWHYFFESADVHIGAGFSERPLLGFYNPLVDAWVIARFRWNGDALAPADMVALPGAIVREKAGAVTATAYPSRVLSNCAYSSAAFAQLFPPSAPAGDALFAAASVDAQATVLVRTINAHEHGWVGADRGPVARLVQSYIAAAIKGDGAALRALFAANTTTAPDAIVNAPAAARQALQPGSAFRHGDIVEVALTSAAAGRLLVLLDVKVGAHPQLVDVIAADRAALLAAR